MTLDEEIAGLSRMLVEQFSARELTCATAESCTGGLISAAITEVPGSSAVFTHGFVTYANEAKEEVLGVHPNTLQTVGAVSSEVAREMVLGALHSSSADAAVAVTGIAGPDGGSEDKPVGLVFVAVATASQKGAFVEQFEFGDVGRELIRKQTVTQALEMLIAYALDEDA